MDIVGLITVLGVILFSMTLHEAMHGFMAYYLGDDTAKLQGRLTLNPIKHIDPFLTILLPVLLFFSGGPIFGGAKPVPFHPGKVRYGEWGAAMVALAGPLTNFLIAFVLFGIAAVFNLINASELWSVLQLAIMVNLGFFIFNMIPIPPLDGSRVLYALAPESVRRGMEAVERMGILLIFAIVMLASPILSRFMIGSMEAIMRFFVAIFGVS